MSIDYALTVHTEFSPVLERLEREMETVHSTLVRPTWNSELHGFPQTAYGYMMVCFSVIDALSHCWKGKERPQTPRMVAFMQKYLSADEEACRVAVHIWRHSLMHTAGPRPFSIKEGGQLYSHLFHWGEKLSADQHFRFGQGSSVKILKIRLDFLVRDLKWALDAYLADLSGDQVLQANAQKAMKRIQPTHKTR